MLQAAWLAEEAGLRAAQVDEGGRRGFVFPRSALALQDKLFTESFQATCNFSFFLSARQGEPRAERDRGRLGFRFDFSAGACGNAPQHFCSIYR